MTEAQIYAELTEVFHDLLGDDTIVLEPHTSANDVEGWDSFKHINILVAVETRFGIRLGSAEIEKLKNVGDLVQAIQAKSKA